MPKASPLFMKNPETPAFFGSHDWTSISLSVAILIGLIGRLARPSVVTKSSAHFTTSNLRIFEITLFLRLLVLFGEGLSHVLKRFEVVLGEILCVSEHPPDDRPRKSRLFASAQEVISAHG